MLKNDLNHYSLINYQKFQRLKRFKAKSTEAFLTKKKVIFLQLSPICTQHYLFSESLDLYSTFPPLCLPVKNISECHSCLSCSPHTFCHIIHPLCQDEFASGHLSVRVSECEGVFVAFFFSGRCLHTECFNIFFLFSRSFVLPPSLCHADVCRLLIGSSLFG